MASSSTISDHRLRFDKRERYYDGAAHKALYIIGEDVGKVCEKVKAVKTEGVEIIGLVPNRAHSHYTVLVRTKDAEAGSDPISFGVECDLVARSFRTNGGVPDIQCVQELSHIDLPAGPLCTMSLGCPSVFPSHCLPHFIRALASPHPLPLFCGLKFYNCKVQLNAIS